MGIPSTSSLPPSNSRYPAVWPVSIPDTDGHKLIIGTKTFDVLVTSSLRLDRSMDPEIGPNTSNFNLDTEAKSLGTKIFIKKTAWTAAKILADQPVTNRLTRYDVLSQLRQLRSKFHHSSTYLCCRASNEETDDLTAKPFTIFTTATRMLCIELVLNYFN